ncbi:acyltransferase family protein [Pseudalkalibacillus salsuginis]|uniref:acyltransferase family protein n=1 Tax=Pseudalkalibacillus salsuginis TaxID=2910972 RepID=UPI001F38C7E5|nr:acyltransferase family protein [Pseudalkalibacillus salsuginis]MCF6411156.1 acyltransferase family protein [Pseudalkalibacillus salsuginis]
MSKKRESYFDNAKFILIFLVVFGHFISPHKGDSEALYTVYNFIYTFHMPAFILIGGFFSKSIMKKGYLKKIFRNILIPYFIFQFIYFVLHRIWNGKETLTLFDPYWTLWFLLSMVLWNILLLLFIKLKHPAIMMAVALTIGIFAGYIQDIGTYFSLSRTFVFFPVFLGGYLLKKEHFTKILRPEIRIAAGTILIGMFVSYYFFFPQEAKDWLLASSSYEELGVELGQAWFIRLLMYGLMALATFSFMTLVPRRKMFFTHLGTRTLYVYLLHGFIVKLFELSPFYDLIGESGNYFVLLILAAIVTLILASKPIITLAQPMIELKTHLLQRYRNRKTADVS